MNEGTDYLFPVLLTLPLILMTALSIGEIFVLRSTKWIESSRAVTFPLINLILSIPLAYVLFAVSFPFRLLIVVVIGNVLGGEFNINYAPWVYIVVPGDVLVSFVLCFCGFSLLRILTQRFKGEQSSLTGKYDLVFAVIASTMTMSLWLIPVLLQVFKGSPPYNIGF